MAAQFQILSILYEGLGKNIGGDFQQPLPTLDKFLNDLTPLFTKITYEDCQKKAQEGDRESRMESVSVVAISFSVLLY